MSDNSHIEWTDATLNFATGCTKVSEGCRNCYIDRTPPFRMAGRAFAHPTGGNSGDPGATTGVLLYPERLDQALRWQRSRKIFTPSLSDWLHDDVPDSLLARLFATIALTPQHTYQLTTKRPARGRSLLRSERFRDVVTRAILDLLGEGGRLPAHLEPLELRERWWPLRNAWIGVSVEDQAAADLRIPILYDTPAAVRWISAEPLLGPINLNSVPDGTRLDGGSRHASALTEPCPKCGGWGTDCGIEDYHFTRRRGGLDWVVVGGESGPDARPMHPDWARSLRDQCVSAGVPHLYKQTGEWAPAPWHGPDGATHAFTGTLGVDGAPHFMRLGHSPTSGERDLSTPAGAQGMRRVGKKAAGRELDGRTWDEYPAVPA